VEWVAIIIAIRLFLACYDILHQGGSLGKISLAFECLSVVGCRDECASVGVAVDAAGRREYLDLDGCGFGEPTGESQGIAQARLGVAVFDIIIGQGTRASQVCSGQPKLCWACEPASACAAPCPTVPILSVISVNCKLDKALEVDCTCVSTTAAPALNDHTIATETDRAVH
jgi:hypothetical protein